MKIWKGETKKREKKDSSKLSYKNETHITLDYHLKILKMIKLIPKNSLIGNDYGLCKKWETNLRSYYIWSIFCKG